MNLNLVVTPRGASAVQAAYNCPCGCQPSVSYERGGADATDGCCCGNHFAVGPLASASVASGAEDRMEVRTFAAPWGEPLQAAWALVPNPSHGHDATHEGGHAASEARMGDPAEGALDPVCGMTVDPSAAREKGMYSRYRDTDYFFCSKGCKLEFEEDPERYLDPAYVPSM